VVVVVVVRVVRWRVEMQPEREVGLGFAEEEGDTTTGDKETRD
jgi:hypothetical protein